MTYMNETGINKQLLARRVGLIIYDILAVMASSAIGLLMRFDMSYTELVNTMDSEIWIDNIWHYLPITMTLTFLAVSFLFWTKVRNTL